MHVRVGPDRRPHMNTLHPSGVGLSNLDLCRPLIKVHRRSPIRFRPILNNTLKELHISFSNGFTIIFIPGERNRRYERKNNTVRK